LDENFYKKLMEIKVHKTCADEEDDGTPTSTQGNERVSLNTNKNSEDKRLKKSLFEDIIHKINIPKSANHTPQMRSRNNSKTRKNIEINTDTIIESNYAQARSTLMVPIHSKK
jgi:hypothetical protein